MPVEFDVTLSSSEQQFNTVMDTDAEFNADFSVVEQFNAEMADDSAVFDSDLTDDSTEFTSDFGVNEIVDVTKVRSVNGMVGDVVIHIPELVSELENDSGYITDTGMDALSNMEIENLLGE